ncbi:MAG: lysophospholipid acyltransferase family protein [Synergistaceae bacterium]|nr:lysophospholipid acyltransferase family protein [Synergistaceae bacterium]
MNWKVTVSLKLAHLIKPGWRANSLAALLIWLIKLIGPRKKVARENIEIAFPGITKENRDKLVAQSYESMIWTGIELLALHKDPSQFDEWVEHISGLEYMKEALEKGKGVIVVASHIANWEFANIWLGKQANTAAIVRESDNLFQRELIAELRSPGKVHLIDKKEPMTRALSYLKKNGVLGLMSDQHAGEEGIKVPFFGHETGTVIGPAVFAYLTGATILPFTFFRVAPFRTKIMLEPPIVWKKGPDRDRTIREITILVNKALEKQVLRSPGQWLWQHRRFREITGD